MDLTKINRITLLICYSFVLDSVEAYPYGRSYSTPLFGESFPEENMAVDNTFLTQGDILMDVRRNAVRDHDTVWQRRIVPFTVDTAYPPSTLEQIHLAIQEIEQLSCIRFKPRGDEIDYIRIRNMSGCYSPVGRRGGPQDVSIGNGCESQGTIIHELMHALGFWHEHTRPDRDLYITVIWHNIDDSHSQNFQKMTYDEVNTLDTPYDYGSIMHYALNAFAIDRSKWTMIPKIATTAEIGQRKHLSKIDIFKLNKLYNCNITHCPSIVSPKHGFKQGSDYAVGELVFFFCRSGFILTGSGERFCKDTGDWTGNQPVCLPRSVQYCNFDKVDLCGWRQDTSDDLDWTWTHSATPTMNTGPNADHTLGTSKGSYLYLESSSPVRPGQKARLISSVMHPFAHDMCLRFWYHMYGNSMGKLRVYLRERNQETNIFSGQGDQGKEWHAADLVIKPRMNFQIIFEAMAGSSFRSDIAIDDVLLTTCTIMKDYKNSLKNNDSSHYPGKSQADLLTNQYCNFDGNLCNWIQERYDTFDWTHHYGPTMTMNTGPPCDHTNCATGKYLYIETSSPRITGDYAAIYTPVFQGLGQKCVKFYYNMFGSSMGTLNVYLKNSTGPHLIWTKSNNQGPLWHFAKINVLSASPFQIVFEGVRGNSYRSDIALDDFSLEPKSCIEHSITCDFQRDLCSWLQDNQDNFDWTRHSGPTGTPGTGPVVGDHTSNGGHGGYYLYIEASAPRHKGEEARLLSPLLSPIPGGYCFQLWYCMYGTHIASLKIIIKTNDRETTLWSKNGNLGPAWMGANISFSIPETSQLIIVASVGDSYRSDIAIDDTSLTPGPCT